MLRPKRLPHGMTVGHEVGRGADLAHERRFDLEEINIGDEAIDAGIDAAGRVAEKLSVRRQEARQHLQILDASFVDLIALISANSLIEISLMIVIPRRFESAFRHPWGMAFEKRLFEEGIESIIAPPGI